MLRSETRIQQITLWSCKVAFQPGSFKSTIKLKLTMHTISLEAFMATELNEIFLGATQLPAHLKMGAELVPEM